MSDLACAATVIAARHGRAAYVEEFFSDEGGTLTRQGREQSLALADALAGRRVARVWCSDSSRAVQTAEIVAGRLGVDVVARKSLREVYVGELMGRPFSIAEIDVVTRQWLAGDLSARFAGGESGVDLLARYRDQIGEIADLHRGETVLMVAHQTALGTVLPRLASNVSPSWAAEHGLANGQAAELLVDADDWVVTHWAGHDLVGSGR